MEKTKDLLYYVGPEKPLCTYAGKPVTFYDFKSVKTGSDVKLGTCEGYAKEVVKIIKGTFYNHLSDALNDFDFLWTSSHNPSPLSASFEDIKREYDKMISDGVSEEEAAFALISRISEFNKGPRTR